MPSPLPVGRRRTRTRIRDHDGGTCTADGCTLLARKDGRCHKHHLHDVQQRTIRRK